MMPRSIDAAAALDTQLALLAASTDEQSPTRFAALAGETDYLWCAGVPQRSI
jgi:hypothetical protein